MFLLRYELQDSTFQELSRRFDFKPWRWLVVHLGRLQCALVAHLPRLQLALVAHLGRLQRALVVSLGNPKRSLVLDHQYRPTCVAPLQLYGPTYDACTLVRLFGAGMILATFFLFNSSEYISSLDTSVAWIWRCCILVQVSLMLPLPRTLRPKEMLQLFQNRWCQSIPYDALKAAGSILSYCAFEWLGSTVKIHNDRHLMYASITFFLFLVIVDLLYDVEDAIAICDGYVTKRSNRDIILALIEKPEPVTEDIPLLPLTTQPTVSPSIQNQSDAVAKKEEEESCQVLDMSGVVRGDQKALYRPGSFTRVRSNTDKVGYD
ncbi:hypothetical protein DY000_02019550 [Brassica cretica]|uniref:Uncharacterized protein n=1 Tax=Brassica cretica TaxID=69181 RepID=A0ABQ7CW80_BRACR|nr:hypothetical protein DY000_02019550 [Brassica cretica]